MMLRSGWDGRKGLGPEGQGQRYPVKTILKKDRKCLGYCVQHTLKQSNHTYPGYQQIHLFLAYFSPVVYFLPGHT
jgi:hypothetical protein